MFQWTILWDCILIGRHDSLALNFRRKQTHVARSSDQLPVFISWATIQISAACCYRDVLRLVSSCWCVLWHFLDQHGETDHFDWLVCQRSAVGYMCKQLYMYMWIGLKTPSALKWTRKWSESSLSELIMWTQRKHSFIMGTVVFTLNKITAVWQTPYKITQINKIKLANV